MIGLTADKLLLIAVLIGFLFGPERLPHLAERLGSAVRAFRGHLTNTEQRMRDELGVDIDVKDWKKLDPRQYDPRTIIRDALTIDAPAGNVAVRTDRDVTAVLGDGTDDVERNASRVAGDSPGPDASAEPETRPVFRRRSDGHLELVPVPVPAEVPDTEVALPVTAETAEARWASPTALLLRTRGWSGRPPPYER